MVSSRYLVNTARESNAQTERLYTKRIEIGLDIDISLKLPFEIIDTCAVAGDLNGPKVGTVVARTAKNGFP